MIQMANNYYTRLRWLTIGKCCDVYCSTEDHEKPVLKWGGGNDGLHFAHGFCAWCYHFNLASKNDPIYWN